MTKTRSVLASVGDAELSRATRANNIREGRFTCLAPTTTSSRLGDDGLVRGVREFRPGCTGMALGLRSPGRLGSRPSRAIYRTRRAYRSYCPGQKRSWA